ncbi:MAG: DMT family transporter [Archangium sp.]
MSTPARNGPFIIAVSSLFFGLMAVVARLVAGQVPSPQLATIRLTVGAVFCLVVFAIQRRTPPMRRWRALVMRGVFGGIAVVTYFYSIERLGAARGTVLNYTSPIYAALFANWFLHEKSSSAQRLGLVVATIGAALVTLSTAGATAWWVPDIGAVAGIVSAVTAGAAITVIRKLRDDTDALTVFAAFCVFGAFTTAPMAAMSWAPLTWTTFSICVAVGVLSIGGQLLFTWGMGFTSATTGSAVTQLVPLISWLLALVWLGERATPLGLVGALVCVGGVLLGVIPWRALLERRSGAALPERELPQVLPLEDAGAVKVTKGE